MGAELFHADGHTDARTDGHEANSHFSHFANAPKNIIKLYTVAYVPTCVGLCISEKLELWKVPKLMYQWEHNATKYLKSSKDLSAKHSPTDRKNAAYSLF